MLRKNFSENRFKTAGTKIFNSRKLPRDFFPASRQSDSSLNIDSRWSRHKENSFRQYEEIPEFTFRRINSEGKRSKNRGESNSHLPEILHKNIILPSIRNKPS